MRIVVPYVLALALAGSTGLSAGSDAVADVDAEIESSVVVAGSDAYVRVDRRGDNFGRAGRLMVDGRTTSRAYALLRVRVPASAVDAGTLELVLHPLVSSTVGVRVYGTGTGWRERTLTWRRLPERRALLGASDGLSVGEPEAIALVGDQWRAGQVVSLRVETTGRKRLGFASTEAAAATRPLLRFTSASAPLPSPPPTPTSTPTPTPTTTPTPTPVPTPTPTPTPLPTPTPTATPTPTPTPVPAPVRTMFGACPTSGTPVSSVIAKYGVGASVRQFVPGGFGAAVVRPAGTSRMHVSWKPALGSPITDSQLVTAFANLKDGDMVEVWHEADVKYRKGADLAAMLAMKNQLHDRVVALRDAGRIAQVLTVNTWAGWSVDSTSNVNPANLHARADLLGIDMDGIPESDNFYPYAARQMGAKFINAYKAGGYKGWTVPEFTMPSVASDPTHARRTEWFKAEAAAVAQGVASAGVPAPRMIAWFDTAGIIGDSERLSTVNEIAVWSNFVASNE